VEFSSFLSLRRKGQRGWFACRLKSDLQRDPQLRETKIEEMLLAGRILSFSRKLLFNSSNYQRFRQLFWRTGKNQKKQI